MRAYDNNNYYGYNNNSMTPSSSSNESQISHGGGGGDGSGGQEYLSNVSTTPQSSDAEMNYHTSSTLKRSRTDKKNQRVSSGSFTVIGSNNNHDDEIQNDSSSYGAKINLQIPTTLDTITPTSQFRVQQPKRSHRKNTSFSIMTELPPTSRSPSPPALSSTSGRVSPFRGRGFRPGASSRHTTPSSSPPPPILPSDSNNNNNNNNITGGMNVQPYYEDQTTIRNINYINSSDINDSKQDSSIYRQQSRIPRTTRIDNRKKNEIQDKSLLHTNQLNNTFMNQGVNNSSLNNNSLSRSLSNLPVKPGISRPPPSPRRNGTKQAFTQLSPIIGTPKMSPDTTSFPTKSILKPSKSAFVLISKDETNSEDSKTLSPSKIPRSTSLNRLSKSIESLSKEPTLNSRNSTIKTSQSRLQSRETSPNSKPPTGPRRTVSKNIPKQISTTAKSTNISRTSSMKNLSKPNSRAPSRSTSPANIQSTTGSSPNKINRLAPKPVNRGTSRSRSPSTNPTSRSSSPNKSRKPIAKTTTTIRGSNSLHPSRSTSPAVNRATNSTSRGPSPNRLAVPRERTVNRSRDTSPNKNKKPTTKSPTRIPMKSNNNYKNVISKIDSNNKRATNNITNKPKIPPKPNVDSDNNHKSKTRESRLSRQMSKDKNIGKTNVNEKSKKLLKSSSSKKLITIPGENATNSDTKPSSEAQKSDQVSKDNQDNPTTSEDNETETTNNNDSEDAETRPTPTLATLIAQNFDSNASNVVSVTTETATAPLHIDAPKPQIPVAPIENLLSKPVADKPSIGDVKQTSSSNVLSNIQNKPKNDKTVPSLPEDGNNSPPKPMKNQSNMPETTNSSAPVSDSLKQSAETQNETNVSSSNKESDQSIKEESKILTKKNSEKKIETSNVNNNNTTVITHSNSVDKNSISNLTNSLQTNANNNTQNLPIIVSDKVKPIQIQVKERGTNLDVQSGNIERRPSNGTITGKGEPRLPSSNATHNADSTTEDENNKKSFCGRIFSCCKFPACCSRCRKNTSDMDSRSSNANASRGCLSCCRKNSEDASVESEPIVAEQRRSDASDRSQGLGSTNSDQRTCCMKFRDVICCSRKNKVSDLGTRPKGCFGGMFSCCRRNSNEENWAERRDSILSDAPPRKCCPGGCWPFCRRKSQDSVTEPDSRRTSMLDKKKSLSPSTIQPPTEKRKPALDESLVEHTSEMRGAIPVLPIPLAWICLMLNCILPGVGTILSGIFCLCFGKPRFSVHDGARARLGSFIINLIVGVAQMFCVLFCLVGWGWSIWWGVIMLRVARKHKRMKPIDEDEENERVPTATNANHNGPDVERGRS